MGILAIVLGTICFSINDISVKLFSTDMPLHQLMFFRAIFAISILLFIVLPFYGGLKYLNTNNPTFHVFRGLAVVGAQENPITMGFYIQICFLVTSLTFAGGFYTADLNVGQSNALIFLTGSWVSINTFDLLHIFVGIAFPICIGGILVSYAYKNHEASFLAPFEYGALIIAVISTYLIWNEIPDRLSLSGIILIMCSGIFVSLREKQVSSIRSSRKLIYRR